MRTMRYLLAGLLLTAAVFIQAKDYKLASPNGKLSVTVGHGVTISVSHQGCNVVTAKAALGGMNGRVVGFHAKKVQQETIVSPFYRQPQFTTAYSQADVKLSGGFGMQVRVYDEGVAYRFSTTTNGETIITDETAVFGFPQEAKAWLSYTTNAEKPFAMAFQNTYHETLIRDARPLPAFLPATVDCGSVKVTILESDLRAYPGMFLKADGDNLTACFAPYPKKMDYYRWRGMSYVSETEDYIAKSTGRRTYPWRVMAITENDTEMPVNNLVYALATPNQIGSTDWIRPGKVAWDWWNDWNLRGVDFVAGINTDTYLYYIDFAAKNNIPYVVLDEGWYNSAKGDIMNPIAAIDLPRLIAYGQKKGVGIVLWTVFNVLDEHLQEACGKYAKMGVKGFKVDFMDRNDQTAVEMAERIAKACADHQLFLDYHGYFAPTGMSRTFPNILNYEGVFGMEECRWAKKDTDMPLYDVTFPFIRMMAGSVDFTPGAMRNGTRENWVECYQNPVSMGTRCHQAACYVVHDSPFTMLCDAPTNYEPEPEYTSFIASIPDEWDETRVLQGEIGKYIVTARRKASTWYVAGQTNWDKRDIELKLDFLGDGTYTATCLTDGINANHNAEDYQLATQNVKRGDTLPVAMAGGGGFVMCFRPENRYEMDYTVKLDTAGHYLLVQLDYKSIEKARQLMLTMPLWAPGYYEMLNFPKHLTDFAATDADGKPLRWKKEGMNNWRVDLEGQSYARINYRVYANERDVASSRVESQIAFIAPPGVFMYADGEVGHPVRVTVDMPQGWQNVATGLKSLKPQFYAETFDVLYDSPMLLGNFYKKTFSHEGHDYEFALETPDGVEEAHFEQDFKSIVSAATRLMGDVPYDNYSLIHMGEGQGGLEHLNSQACYTDGTFRFATRSQHVRFLAFTAHEYFHLYNVKCIRPAELWPIDYNRPAVTPMLWVSEGLTCYYEFRLLREAGVATTDEVLEVLSNYFRRYAPYEGQHHMSLRQSSYDIWLNFMNNDDNERDVRVNYYFKGPVIGLLLDLDIRQKTQNRQSLDDVMRRLYNHFYKTLRRGFTEEEFWQTVEQVAGQNMDEMRRIVDTTADIDYDRYLKPAGLCVDTTTWTIRRVEQPTEQQRLFLKSMNME